MKTNIDYIKKCNVAEYGGADWKNLVAKKTGFTLDEAKKFADNDSKIKFFFFMRSYMDLGDKGTFKKDDAVFFSGEPWWGSAPQADGYIKAITEIVKVPNVAEYGGADWKNEIERQSDISLDKAFEIANANDEITFFFYMREFMSLPGKGDFKPNDAVFFSGKPWYGSAPQADSYYKAAINWSKKENVAEYGGASWDNLIAHKKDLSLDEAKQFANNNSNISFFFYMKNGMYLPGKGQFNPKDAVFFSGKPWYGSAPQADSYEKIENPIWDQMNE